MNIRLMTVVKLGSTLCTLELTGNGAACLQNYADEDV